MPPLNIQKKTLPIRHSSSKILWVTWLISSILLILVSGSLIGASHLAQDRWPWPLAPFNAKFFGIVYCSAAIPLISYLLKPNRVLLKIILPIFTCFTTYFFVLSLAHYGSFLERRSSDIWFFLYGADSFVGLLCLWQSRFWVWHKEKKAEATFSRIYLLQAGILAAYGVCNLFFAKVFGQFWSWPLDIFHTHLYSGVFFSASLAMILLQRSSNVGSRIVFALVQIVLGGGTALATWVVDLQVQKLDWSAFAPWLWQIIFLGFGGVGLVILLHEVVALRLEQKV